MPNDNGMDTKNTENVQPSGSKNVEGTQQTVEDAPMELATHSRINLPPFWPQQANNWFRLAEIQFDLRGITSEKSKYAHILSTLSPETCELLSDFLINPPQQMHYSTLKQTLLERLAPSDERQLEVLLSGQELGDRRPSDALRHMRVLAGDNQFVNEKFIRSIWIRKMPEVIRIALVAQPDTTTTDTLAKTADRMFDAMNMGQHQQHQVHAAQTHTPNQTYNTRQSRAPVQSDRGRDGDRRTPSSSSTVEDRLARLEAKLNALFRDSRSRSRGQPSSSRPRSHSPSNNNNRQGKCWYHSKFGTAARKCITPCTFRSSQQSTNASINNMDVDQPNPKNL